MKKMTTTTGIDFLVDDDDYEWIKERNWTTAPNGYVMSTTKKAVPLHRLILKTKKGYITDHIDGNRTNNQKSNLRSCTYTQNARNAKIQEGRTSKYKGVCWVTRDSKWMAYIKINKRLKFLGYFKDEKNAAKAYNDKATKEFGEFARINEI
jgi:hypothetical protein